MRNNHMPLWVWQTSIIFWLILITSAKAEAQLFSGAQGPDPATVLYINALITNGCATPSLLFRQSINNYILAEEAAGNWGIWDMLYILTTNDSCTASINLAQPSLYKITWHGSCSFSVLLGFNGNSTDCYGDTGVNHSALTLMSQDNGHVEAFSGANRTSLLGLISSTAGVTLKNTTNKVSVVNSTLAQGITDTGGGLNGLNAADRTDASHVSTYNNGVVQTSGGASTSSALVAAHITVCQINGSFCNNTSRIYAFGVGQVVPNELAHYTNILALGNALGGEP
jgi:hypothetical protein